MLIKRIAVSCLLCALCCGLALAQTKEPKRATAITTLTAYDFLTLEPRTTFLVDVRSRMEYALQGRAPQAYNVPWRHMTEDFQVAGAPHGEDKALFTGYQLDPKINANFVSVAQSLFKTEDRLIVICNDGTESADAADALLKAGFKKVYQVQHGFWGDKLQPETDNKLAQKYSPFYGQRGKINGWVYWGLPITFDLDPRYIYPPDLKRMQNQ